MPRFTRELRQKAFKHVQKQGFSQIGEQHNGCLFVTIDREGFLQRKVVTMQGRILSYKTRKPTKEERQLYGLA